MSREPFLPTRSGWLRAYHAALFVLPRAMREKHGEAMQALFARDLARQQTRGVAAVWRTAFAGLGDLLARGSYERFAEERTAWNEGGAADVRRVVGQLVMAAFTLTGVMLANYAHQRYAGWQARGVEASTIAEMLLYAVPFTAALTVPMAVFVAVLLANRRRHARHAPVRTVPLLTLAGALALAAFAWNAEVVPRANAHLVVMQSGQTVAREHDRTLTLAQLQARVARLETELATERATERATSPTGAATSATLERLAEYRVEIHKKGAIAAACVVFTLLAIGITRRASGMRVMTVALVSLIVFSLYYVGLTLGETAADRHVIPPALGMWGTNGVLMVLALALLRPPRPLRTGRPLVA